MSGVKLWIILAVALLVLTGSYWYRQAVPDFADQDGRIFTHAPDFAAISDIKQRKRAFFNYFAPIVLHENSKIEIERVAMTRILTIFRSKGHLDAKEAFELQRLAVKYKWQGQPLTEQGLELLLRRIDVIPVEMVLVQAANESGWGTSRFSVEANNFFGQWCFRKGCGVVPLQRDGGAQHEVAKFSAPQNSVQAYLLNINTHSAYQQLRKLRALQRAQADRLNAYDLIGTLSSYSERGDAYIEELRAMLQHNLSFIQAAVQQAQAVDS